MWSGDEPSRNLTWLLSLASYLRGSSLIWLSHISHSPASLGDPIVTNLIACGLPPFELCFVFSREGEKQNNGFKYF